MNRIVYQYTRNDVILRDLESTRVQDLIHKKATYIFEKLRLYLNMKLRELIKDEKTDYRKHARLRKLLEYGEE